MTRTFPRSLFGMVVSLLPFLAPSSLLPTASAAFITADYVDDFQTVTPATGWRYLWNEFGLIGTATNYDDLAWYAPEGMYTATGGHRQADPTYADLFLGENSSGPGTGHPGPGTLDGAPFDRYAIAAYTLQAGDPTGLYTLANSTIRRQSSGPGAVDVRVYTNDMLKFSGLVSGGLTTNFNTDLGALSPGDTVYVAMGPHQTKAVDTFQDLDFSLAATAIPEPSPALLALIGGLAIFGYCLRRRPVPV